MHFGRHFLECRPDADLKFINEIYIYTLPLVSDHVVREFAEIINALKQCPNSGAAAGRF